MHQRMEWSEFMAGTLYLCATPIGNLEDITYRVVRILGEVDLIAAEDTRNSMKLLTHFDIHTPLTSYHEYNRFDKAHTLVDKLLEGQNIALITDAGTPGISDPGEELVREAIEAGITVTSLPGACACVTALSASGLKTRRFCFEAFLPTDKKVRRDILDELVTETRTIIIYEAPHRLVKTLSELLTVLGDRQVTVCRELTKKHETYMKTTLSKALSHFTDTEPKGECVLVIEGLEHSDLKEQSREEWLKMSIDDHMDHYMSQGLEKKEAMKAVAKDRGVTKQDIYRYFI